MFFVWPVPDNLQDIYGEVYYKGHSSNNEAFGYSDYEKDKEPMREVFIDYLKKIEKIVSGRKILDIGCANGYFLDLARQRGWQTYGVEISEYAVREAEKKGHRAFLGALDKLNIEERFDCIAMWDVLEHIPQPKDYLKIARGLLVEEGTLIINTIDKSSLWAKFWGKRWNAIIPPEHLLFFSGKNLNYLLDKTDFKILESHKIAKKFSLVYIFKVLYHWQGLKIFQKLSQWFDNKFWRKFKIPINLRDNIVIISKKK